MTTYGTPTRADDDDEPTDADLERVEKGAAPPPQAVAVGRRRRSTERRPLLSYDDDDVEATSFDNPNLADSVILKYIDD